MELDELFGYVVITLTLFVAFVFSVLALPDFIPQVFGYLRPDWVLLVLVYWILALPGRVGIGWAWVTGLFVDVMTGSLLGIHGISFVLIAYILVSQYQKVRMYSVVQQAGIVFGLVFASQLLGLWLVTMTSDFEFGFLYFMPSMASGLVWPFAYLVLRGIRRKAGLR